MKSRAELLRRDILEFVASIEDSYIRQIFIYRYIDGLSCWDVADKLGGGNTGNSVSQTCSRYFKKYRLSCGDGKESA